MSNINQNNSPETEQVGYERRDVGIRKLLLIGIAGILAIVIVMLVLMDYYTAYTEKVISEVVLEPESKELRELRARESEVLGSYKLLDEQKGIYRIPIDSAIELMLEEAEKSKK